MGSYAHSLMQQPMGFQLNGAAAPTVFRDGTNVASAKKMVSITRVSAGLYTIQLDAKTPWPELPFIYPHIEQAAAPVAPCKVVYVKGSYSKATRSFQVQVLLVGATLTASDGDAGDRVTVLLMGSVASPGTDPA
jgi:hypothetical protein